MASLELDVDDGPDHLNDLSDILIRHMLLSPYNA
jgi:hypothetical protein